MDKELFSKRHGYHPPEAEIIARDKAPHEFRGVLVELAYECGYSPKTLRSMVCRVLRKRPDENNWSEYPNIHEELIRLIDECEWYKVYDIVEEIYNEMLEYPSRYEPGKFEKELNEYFIEAGIGWHLKNGRIEIRGPEPSQRTLSNTTSILDKSRKVVAKDELNEAIKDLSRRPEADTTGAIQHAMAALECVARDVCGDDKATLGYIIKRFDGLIPKPLDKAIEKIWGFASENARHLREGRKPRYEEAELIVGLCAAVCTYLIEKQ